MPALALNEKTLRTENAELRAKVEELEETLRAIQAGEVDAVVVQSPAGPQIFTLDSADAESNRVRGAILANVSDAVVAIDGEERLIYLNAAAERQYGVTGSEVLGGPIGGLYEHRWLQPDDEAQVMRSLSETGHWMGENIHIKRSGEVIRVESSVTRLLAADGKPSGFFATIRDITERRALEDALIGRAADLAEADRSKDEFLAMLAHELRNPLAPLRNGVEILKHADVSPEERDHAQRILVRQIENMTRLIDDLLDVSRITKGKIELRREPVGIEAILTAAVSTMRSGIAKRGQSLTVVLPPEPVYLNADATRLEQVFGNLLGNACKYGGDGCRIVLSAERAAEREPPEIVVRVSDNGIGIAPELLPRIFDLFVQATRALDRAHGGLGIGLTLVQRLVELHGGIVEARSEGLGRGSEFCVRLPILLDAPILRELAQIEAAPEAPRRILIVDDNTDSARSLAMIQTRRGHETRTAFSGPDAVAMAAEFLPEVVLLDIGLPGMDGLEVARRLRTMPGLEKVMLIAMTGYGREEDRDEARVAGFDRYMVKPVDLEKLREWLRVDFGG